MNILEQIKAYKLQEVKARKRKYPIKQLEQSEFFGRSCNSLKNALTNPSASGIIAEFKRKSPSKGAIHINADVLKVTQGYTKSGASALSVLTDEYFFGARKDDFLTARRNKQIPILRKDFMIDEYQILESKAMGADVLLLIAKLLLPKQIKTFTELAQSLGMEVLTEFHSEEEIREKENSRTDAAGINNRNLNSFEVDIQNSIRLAGILAQGMLKIAESGIESPETVRKFRENGFSGFLTGEYFMRNQQPEKECEAFINELRQSDKNFK